VITIVVYCCVVLLLPDVTRFCSIESALISTYVITKHTAVGADPAALCESDEFCHQGWAEEETRARLLFIARRSQEIVNSSISYSPG
jgi:hypothetical protein